jgi:hypothetical protein
VKPSGATSAPEPLQANVFARSTRLKNFGLLTNNLKSQKVPSCDKKRRVSLISQTQINNMLPSFYHSILEKYLTPAQLLTLQMLVWLLQTQKEVRIERLAATLQLPILQSSRRRHIQRFLKIKALSILILWFPIVKQVISRQLKAVRQLVIALDRTQWKEHNVLMVSAIVQKRAFPYSGRCSTKKGLLISPNSNKYCAQ